MRAAAWVAATLIALAACGGDNTLKSDPDIDAGADIRVESSFDDGDEVAVEYTCDGDDISPPLTWSAVPDVAEFAIIVTDPDAPGGTYVHWVVYGIPGSAQELERGALPKGALEGANSFGDASYGGPCPPSGDDPHHYEFTVYALNEVVAEDLDSGASAEEVLDAIRPAVAAQGTLVGAYAR